MCRTGAQSTYGHNMKRKMKSTIANTTGNRTFIGENGMEINIQSESNQIDILHLYFYMYTFVSQQV